MTYVLFLLKKISNTLVQVTEVWTLLRLLIIVMIASALLFKLDLSILLDPLILQFFLLPNLQ
jgi:hypothetical protein